MRGPERKEDALGGLDTTVNGGLINFYSIPLPESRPFAVHEATFISRGFHCESSPSRVEMISAATFV